jgi:tetratricopeptide (TPR) repeat protein
MNININIKINSNMNNHYNEAIKSLNKFNFFGLTKNNNSLNAINAIINIINKFKFDENNEPFIAKCYEKIGDIYSDINDKCESINYFNKAGLCYEKNKLYNKSIKCYLKLISNCDKDNIIANKYSYIGNIYYKMNNYIESIKYYNKSIEYYNASSYKSFYEQKKIKIKEKISYLYIKLNEFDKSFLYLEYIIFYKLDNYFLKSSSSKYIFYALLCYILSLMNDIDESYDLVIKLIDKKNKYFEIISNIYCHSEEHKIFNCIFLFIKNRNIKLFNSDIEKFYINNFMDELQKKLVNKITKFIINYDNSI